MTLLLGFGSVLVLWMGSREVIRGRISLGEFVAFNGYLVMLSWPMIAFGWVTNMLQRGMASWKRMLEVIDAVPSITDAHVTPAGRAAALTAAIEVRHLTFAYPGASRPVLDDVSLRIEPGQTVAFVGATGSGKSTLMTLLPRLHEPPAGTIFIGGVDIREIPLAALRGAIGFVPQEPFLFSDTVRGNIAFGVGEADATEARIREAAAIARLDKDVEEFPHGYETLVGERGITMSGGQKQRTALARAVMVDPTHPRPGRRPVGGGYLHRGGDPVETAPCHAAAHVHHRRPPGLDRARCRSDRRARRRTRGRARQPRDARGRQRALRGAVPQTVA